MKMMEGEAESEKDERVAHSCLTEQKKGRSSNDKLGNILGSIEELLHSSLHY